MTKSSVILAILTLALSVSAADRLSVREHMLFTRAGHGGVMTELIAGDNHESIYTLFQARSGERLIFMYSTDVAKTTTISITDPRSGEFVRGSFTVRAGADTPDGYDVPFSVITKTFHGTARQQFWHGAEGAKTRASLADHLSPAFFQEVVRYSQELSSAGSPAARAACDALVSLLADKPACHRDKAVVVQPLDADCSFDANFGFPCGPSE